MKKAEATLSSLQSSLTGEPGEQELRSIWRSYVMVEKSVAFIRVELNEENPGRFIKPKVYAVPDERQAIGFALRFLKTAIESFDAGRLAESLRDLRESRNYLRVMLRQKRLLRARKARAAKG
ncbi:MAG: hypothetical protein LYZ69_02520 [Nitrososphaerales archaeon]|nr:hypothetical protein [Nitrososphaerales archaeon]